MNFTTVFDITTEGYKQLGYVLNSIPFVIIGILLVLNLKYKKINFEKYRTFYKIFSIFWLVFSIILLITNFWGTYSDYIDLKNAYLMNKCEVVEGFIKNFKPMPYTGHQEEYFEVNNTKFTYSNFSVMPGFNNTTSHGGPIREGFYVRIHYKNNNIAKLEIRN